MSSCKELLKDLEYYCMVENGLEAKKDANRKQYNFQRLMNAFREKRKNEQIKTRYDTNISKVKAMIDKFEIIHNTSLDSIIGIIQNGGLLSIDEMEKRDISFNFRISFRGINDEMHKFVFGTIHKGDPVYGFYELKFKRDVEAIEGAMFLPKSNIEYGLEVLNDYYMDIKDWRSYLTEEIAMLDNPGSYLEGTPLHLRPEFLFPEQISFQNIESISCANDRAATELIRRVKKEFGENSEVLGLIKSTEAQA